MKRFMNLLVLFALFLFSGFSLAADAATPAPDFLGMLKSVADFVLNNPGIAGPVVAWVLTLIPGPFRMIASAILNWLLEQAKGKVAATAVRAAFDEVRPDTAPNLLVKESRNAAAFNTAVTHALALGLSARDAEPRVRSAFRELKAAGEVK